MSTAPNYKDTLTLPQTSFPMRGDLVENEPKRLEIWEKSGLYQKITAARKAAGAPDFILHDGPPFANGDVHMGTALNKLLKDMVVKSKTMAGFHAPFVPGWDCHGLPIEFKVVKQAAGLEPAEIRRRCTEFASGFIDIQRASFKRLGVFADWQNPYLTMDPAYEANILRVFAKLVENGSIYQSKKPVQWSYGAQTALAEAEVEYADKVSPAIFVKFPLNGSAGVPPALSNIQDINMVIWTTTPWTLPANLGIALHPEFTYVVGKFFQGEKEETFVIVRELLEAFAAKTGYALKEILSEIKGKELEGAEAQHPFLNRTSKIILANFVTPETGTGAVHIAPGHGADDYVVKPFLIREVVLRIRRLLGTYAQPLIQSNRVRFDHSTFNASSGLVNGPGGATVSLTAHEQKLLQLFALNPNRVLSRDEISNALAGREWSPLDRTIDVHIAHLRRKLSQLSDIPKLIRSVRGVGYVFTAEVSLVA